MCSASITVAFDEMLRQLIANANQASLHLLPVLTLSLFLLQLLSKLSATCCSAILL